MKMPTRSIKRFAMQKGLAVCVAFSMMMPLNSYALQSLIEIALTRLAEYMQILAKEAAFIGAWTYENMQKLLANQSSAESMVAVIEKQLGAKKESVQAQINYDAANKTRLRYEKSQDRFTSASAGLPDACQIGDANFDLTVASGSSSQSSSDASLDDTMRSVHTEKAFSAAEEVLKNYRENYCSPQDVERGFCNAAASDPSMQGAPYLASTLMVPASGESYTPKESQAAKEYIKYVTNVVPTEMLPKALEKRLSGSDMFNIAMMSANAKMSVASYSLNQIWASRSADDSTGEFTNGQDGKALSKIGLMKNFVEKRFSDPTYRAKISGMTPEALLQEYVYQASARNWMDYQSHLQEERIEALISTRLAMAVQERNNRQISLAKSIGSR